MKEDTVANEVQEDDEVEAGDDSCDGNEEDESEEGDDSCDGDYKQPDSDLDLDSSGDEDVVLSSRFVGNTALKSLLGAVDDSYFDDDDDDESMASMTLDGHSPV